MWFNVCVCMSVAFDSMLSINKDNNVQKKRERERDRQTDRQR